MTLYAEVPGRRLRQIVGDAALVAWIALWWRVGAWIYELVGRLAGPGAAVERAGRDLALPLERAGDEVSSIPVVGDALQQPFEAAAGAGRSLAAAGAAQQDVVANLALWLGVLLAVIPISLLLALYLPPRLRWVREATAARRLGLDLGDLELFALRAVATRPLSRLRRAAPDPLRALRAGDHAALAALELDELGLRPRPRP
ncbi:MAG: hypothetical protein ABR529_00220 [Actinomycetota bacterium]